jgi:hypothetical protein
MLRLGNQGGQEKTCSTGKPAVQENLGRAKTTSSSPHSSIFTSVRRISIMVNNTIPKTAKYNVGRSEGYISSSVCTLLLCRFTSRLAFGTSCFFYNQYKVFITILFLQVSKLGYILKLPLFKLDYTKLLSVINY